MESLTFVLISLAIFIFALVSYLFLSSKSSNPNKKDSNKEIELVSINKEIQNSAAVISKPKSDSLREKSAGEEKESPKYFDMFCDYVKQNRLINIDQYAKKINTTKEKAIQQMREMENESELVGYLNNNEYFYLTRKELDLLDNLTRKRNKEYTEAEIYDIFKEIYSQSK